MTTNTFQLNLQFITSSENTEHNKHISAHAWNQNQLSHSGEPFYEKQIQWTSECVAHFSHRSVFVQKDIAPGIVSLIFLAEAPFAAFFGYLEFNEKLSNTALWGCLLIIIAIGGVYFVSHKHSHKYG